MNLEQTGLYLNTKLIIYGLFRRELRSDIPADLVLLIKSFCAFRTSIWKFSGSRLKALHRAYRKERWKSEIFCMSGGQIQLRMELYISSEGYVQLRLCVHSIPSDIEHVALCYELACDASPNSLKATTQFSGNGDYAKWHKYTLPLSRLTHRKSVEFSAFADIQFAQYKKQLQSPDQLERTRSMEQADDEKVFDELMYFRSMQMRPVIKYEWTPPKDVAQKMNDFGHYYLPSFSFGCWCVYLAPNGGRKQGKRGEFTVGLVLLGLPFKIKVLECDYDIECNGVRKSDSTYFSYESKQHSRLEESFGQMDRWHLESVRVRISVRRAHDLHYNKIVQSEWNQYFL